MKDHVINSRIPPPLPPALIFVCRAKRTSVRLPSQRAAEHPPSLKIGCAEKTQNRSSINYSLSEIFISHSHLQTPLTIARILQPIPHNCSRHRDSHNQPHMFSIHFTLVLFTSAYCLVTPLTVLRGLKKTRVNLAFSYSAVLKVTGLC